LILSFGISARTPQVLPVVRAKITHGVYYVLPRGLGWQVRYAWGALRPRARRDQSINPKSALGELPRPENLVKKTHPRVTSENNYFLAAFEVNSKPTPEHVPRFVCVWGPNCLAVFIKHFA
jgi:hypothetical protein